MIQPIGPIPARIMLVGESPGEVEEREGMPFMGPSGRILNGILEEVGIVRDACFITNVMLTRPTNNNFDQFYKDKARKEQTDELQEGIRRLQAEIDQVQPNVIVALGEEAMRATTDKRGISNWRGSIVAGYKGHKVIPTFHPAAVSRDWTLRPACVCDLGRVLAESTSSDINQTKRELVIARDYTQAIDLLKQLRSSPYVAFDIETESDQITAIAFAPSDRPNWAVCIPFWFGASGSLWAEGQETAIWNAIREVLTDDGVGKIAHNGSYDIEFVERTMGFHVRPFTFDTMLGMHAMYSELPKALAFAVSIYTDHPYYKYQLKTASMDEYFLYNATDACLTMEIATKLMTELKEEGQWEFYNDFLHGLVEPLLAMQSRGVNFDGLKRNDAKKSVQKEITALQENLNAAVGRELNTNSPKQMKEWLYGSSDNGGLALKVKTKKRKTTGETTISADEEAIEELFAETGNQALKTILAIRERKKLLGTYLEVKLDPDNRIRCSYNITGTETGRLSSSATLRGTGTNLQNIPPGVVKTLFIPDEGKVFINADLSQAEARVVAYLASEERLIRVFREGGDIHRKNAANIFQIPESQISDDQRQLAKRVVHASNYGMGYVTFSRTAGIPQRDAKRLLNQYFATYPGIANWHHEIRAQLHTRRYLVNPFGRKRTFFNRWEDALFKEGLAFIPQSTVADIVTQGLICLHKEEVEILLQVHDSLLVQCREDQVQEVVGKIRKCLVRAVEINGKILEIPVDCKVGVNWEELTKIK